MRLFNRYIRNDIVQITPVDGIVANKALKRTRFEFGYLIPDYEQMISELAQWMREHSKMYPQYHLS